MMRLVAACAVAAMAATASAQVLMYGNARGLPIAPNVDYTGQFTFVRLRYGPPVPYQSQRVPWSHDYPTGEQHFMKIMNAVTNLSPRMMESNVMALDDPALDHFPVAYMAEPGFLTLTDSEAAGFGAYLKKGGFAIFDDFAENRGGWDYFTSQMGRVIPGGRWARLDGTHPIFHAFFEIEEPERFVPPYDDDLRPVYYGLFEDNDPTKRLMAIANFNNDISEYWEFSEEGFAPVDETNEAYKLGVNYIIYGLTH